MDASPEFLNQQERKQLVSLTAGEIAALLSILRCVQLTVGGGGFREALCVASEHLISVLEEDSGISVDDDAVHVCIDALVSDLGAA